MGKTIPWNVELIRALAAGGADQPGAIWCGTIPGGLFRSADHGEPWQLCEFLWISENQGSEWVAVSHHLPPIAALTWVG